MSKNLHFFKKHLVIQFGGYNTGWFSTLLDAYRYACINDQERKFNIMDSKLNELKAKRCLTT